MGICTLKYYVEEWIRLAFREAYLDLIDGIALCLCLDDIWDCHL